MPIQTNIKQSEKVIKSLRDEELERYIMDGLKIGSHKVVNVTESEKETHYLFELESGEKIEAVCPKCLKGTLSKNLYKCTNTNNPNDIIFLSLVRCENLKGECDFTVTEFSSLQSKIVEREKEKAQKISEAHMEKAQRLKHLVEALKENSFWNIVKALFRKDPIRVASVLCLLFIIAIIGFNLLRNIESSIKAELPGGTKIEYNQENPQK